LEKNIQTGPTGDKEIDDDVPFNIAPTISDIVAVPFIDKNTQQKCFWLGKIIRVKETTVLMAWLQNIKDDEYKMKIGSSWEEVCKRPKKKFVLFLTFHYRISTLVFFPLIQSIMKNLECIHF
jgi:hypothetical protein